MDSDRYTIAALACFAATFWTTLAIAASLAAPDLCGKRVSVSVVRDLISLSVDVPSCGNTVKFKGRLYE